MAQQENKIPLSKKGRRDVSPFIGHELLYDYLTGSLDKERRSAVEDHVKFSRDAQMDLAKIQSGQSYAEALADTVVSQPIITQINTPSSYLSVLMQKSNFDKWPHGLKWGLEALAVVAVIVLVLTITPWQKVMELGSGGSKEVILAEVSKTESAPPAIEEKPEFVDEGVVAKEPAGKTPPPPSVPSPTPVKTAAPAASPAAKVAETKAAESAATVPAGTGGFLYRGTIAVTNIDQVGPKINEKIMELGGRKAGSVELGWKKTANSLYYHFTIPEAKYQDLITFLGTYGTAKVGKEKHPRVMPDGIVRMIITVDEAKK